MTYLLMKRGLYWRPDSCGYTGLKREAGRYSDEDSAWTCDGPLADPKTTRIAEDKAPRFSPSCDIYVRQAEAERSLDVAVKALREIANGATGHLDRDSDLAAIAKAALDAMEE